MGRERNRFRAITLIIAVTVLTAGYADEIVNFTLNKSKPDNPWLFPAKKNAPLAQEESPQAVNQPGSTYAPFSGIVKTTTHLCRERVDALLPVELFCRGLSKVKSDCEVDADCVDPIARCDSVTKKCVKESQCVSLIKNGDPLLKADVVFVGDGYTSDSSLKADVLKIVDWNGNQNGFFSKEPFKSNRKKFNIWMISGYDITADANGHYPDTTRPHQFRAECLFSDYTILLSKTDFRSHAYPGHYDAYLSLVDESPQFWGMLFLHEFGHAFGKLADEYVEPSKGNQWRYPNCAPAKIIAQIWWLGVPNLTYDAGCSYVNSNVRPTHNSIMRNHWEATEYGEINKRHLMSVLNGIW